MSIRLFAVTRVVAALFFSAVALQARAFHSGGVAECEGCHSMHNSYGSDPRYQPITGQISGPYLLKFQDQSSTCLSCHGAGTTLSGYHVSTEGIAAYDASTPQQMTPGGDFSWLKKDIMLTGPRGKTSLLHGERRGHNIVAVDFGYAPDATLAVAPGGTYPAHRLACSSCHDPHGRARRFADGTFATTGLPIVGSGSYNSSADPTAGICAVGAYRILAGTNYQPKSLTGSFAFANNVPSAVSPSSYNRAEPNKAGQTFVAYGQGMSEWCANCHTAFISNGYTSGMGGLRHPAGNAADFPAAIVGNYNAYVTSGVMTNTDVNAAYSTITPFEVGTANYSILKPRANLTGAVDRSAATTNNVMCLSCHRAHASGFESMLRFSYLNEFMTIGDAAGVAAYDPSTTEYKINLGFNATQQQKAYNDRPASFFGPWARVQCNKCHAKD